MNEDKFALFRIFSKEYRKASKKQRGLILTEVVSLTNYHRKHAGRLLNNPPSRKKFKRYRPSKYIIILPLLKKLWAASNFSCGTILVPAIPEILESLLRFKEIRASQKDKKLLLKISSATVDRLLKADRKRLEIKGRSGTKPGTLLKHQIPVRIFTPWNEETPGFLEIDLVAHCGESLVDTYINTLDAVDIATTWTERQAIMGKSERVTIEGFELMEKRFPFRVLGVDSDNGSEFINWHFLRMAQRKHITFTRSRAYRSNDQAHIEQKNFSTVRKIIGYRRLETEKQLKILNQIYRLLSDYLNFFIPTLKLVRKEHIGSRVKRIYDKPKTPIIRVLEHPGIDENTKLALKSKSLTLNPAELLRGVNRLTNKLLKGSSF